MNIKFKYLLVMIVFLGGCATVPRTDDKGKSSGQSVLLKKLCEEHQLTYQWDALNQMVLLKNKVFTAEVLVGSELVMVGSDAVLLSAPVKINNSRLIVPPDFKEKVISKFLVKAPDIKKEIVFKFSKEVVIDAGHGGKDPGAIGKSGTKEKDIVLDIARDLRRYLTRHGIKVKMTRGKDVFIPLNERTEIASRSKADLFVSIHANSHPSRSVRGLEVYSLKDLDDVDMKEEQRRLNHKIFYRNLRIADDPQVKSIVEDMLYTHKQGVSEKLAEHVAQKTANLIDTENLGDKRSRFFVLRNTLIPAILVEVGFVTNPTEERLLRTQVYRQKVAKAIASSIMDFLNDE